MSNGRVEIVDMTDHQLVEAGREDVKGMTDRELLEEIVTKLRNAEDGFEILQQELAKTPVGKMLGIG